MIFHELVHAAFELDHLQGRACTGIALIQRFATKTTHLQKDDFVNGLFPRPVVGFGPVPPLSCCFGGVSWADSLVVVFSAVMFRALLKTVQPRPPGRLFLGGPRWLLGGPRWQGWESRTDDAPCKTLAVYKSWFL